ncbi:MAG: alpha-E domain-containing protein [Lentisphaeraceae bacterium]|nr:alpha-E domain-containing protein [Lentisphaeraceae bacterium]
MLSRIANNLYWMGSYIERVEHCARFTEINYFAALDAPANLSSQFSIDSLLKMNGIFDSDITSEEIALSTIGFDKNNPNSIINCVTAVRENARSARDVISTELWETINRYYHFTLNYDTEAFSKTNLFDFTQRIIEQTSIIKGRIDSTLIHNETWTVICLGIFVERTTQILRIMATKLSDLKLLKEDDQSPALKAHQIEAMLRSLESFDMSRKFYRRAPTINSSLEFLLLNKKFPRSILSCTKKLKRHLDNIEAKGEFKPNTAGFIIGKLSSRLDYMIIEEMLDRKEEFISELQDEVQEIRSKIIEEYLS